MCQSDTLNAAQKEQLLQIARKVLGLSLSNSNLEVEIPTDPILNQSGYGVFVSLHKGEELRGCIGCFEAATQLWRTVAEYAIASSKDSRFLHQPVTERELDEIHIEISVLSPLKPIEKYDDAVLGRHGIVVEKGIQKGVLLPQVATDTGWSLEEFWSYCAQYKAGLKADSYLDPSVSLFVFEAEVFGETHGETEDSLT